MRDIGKNIRDLRCAAGMTQEQLAEKLFVTRQTVSSYETGRTRPDLDMLPRIADALGTDANAVLYGPPDAHVQRQKQVKFYISAGALVLTYTLYRYLAVFANAQRNQYDLLPGLWVGMLLAPFVCLVLGWVIVQALAAFTKGFAVDKKARRVCGIAALAALGLYLVPVAAFLLFASFAGGAPRFLSQTVYFMLGVLPWQTKVLPTHLAVAAVVGAALRLALPMKAKE